MRDFATLSTAVYSEAAQASQRQIHFQSWRKKATSQFYQNMTIYLKTREMLSQCTKQMRAGRGHLKHDFRLTERLLPDSTMTMTMTYRGRSDGLVVESNRKQIII